MAEPQAACAHHRERDREALQTHAAESAFPFSSMAYFISSHSCIQAGPSSFLSSPSHRQKRFPLEWAFHGRFSQGPLLRPAGEIRLSRRLCQREGILRSLSSSSCNGGNGGKGGDGLGGRGGGGSSNGDEDENGSAPKHRKWGGLFGSVSNGWQERVRADPQFPFKILAEEIIGVAASVFGDMACRPNFGLSELDFIFSNLIVCAIVNFVLMYILAPTPSTAAARTSLPGYFSRCPPGHMWEPGAYTVIQRAGTFVYKGAVFASVGFCAGLVGTAVSTMLLNVRKKLDTSFRLQNAPPGTLLNACTWALQLGVSSNSRYQLLNGLEFRLERAMKPSIFKGLVFVIRSLNNVVGGMSFMMMARLTGSQHTPSKPQEQDHQRLAVQS